MTTRSPSAGASVAYRREVSMGIRYLTEREFRSGEIANNPYSSLVVLTEWQLADDLEDEQWA